jgi:hypothetical protein
MEECLLYFYHLKISLFCADLKLAKFFWNQKLKSSTWLSDFSIKLLGGIYGTFNNYSEILQDESIKFLP